MQRHFQIKSRVIFYKLVGRGIVTSFGLLGLSSGANATNDNISLSSIGAEGQASGVSYDACGYSGMSISIAASGEKNVNSNGNKPVVNTATVQINRYDSCQGVFIQEFGEVDGVNLSFGGGVNAGQVPKAATAAAQVPMQVTIYTATDVLYSTDNLTFQLTLTQLGPVRQISGQSQESYSVGVSPSTKTTFTDHVDESNSFASISSASVSLAGNSVNPLPPLTQGYLANSKFHALSINH